MKPREYQTKSLKKLRSWREDGNTKALVAMAPGLGKTVVSAFDVQNFFREMQAEIRVLYICDSNEILFHAKKEYKRIFGSEYSYGDFTGISKTNHFVNFLFASFQTMAGHYEEFSEKSFDYIVVDEAHHTPAETYKKSVLYFTPKFLLGLTATPYRLDGQCLNDYFGEPVVDLSLPQAIMKSLVPIIDYRVLLDDVEKMYSLFQGEEKISLKKFNQEYFIPRRDEEIVRLIKEKALDVSKSPRMMIFCQTIEHAEEIGKLIPEAKVVHSKMDQKRCRKVIGEFRKGEIQTIVSVNLLNEGVDIPDADVIVFLRNTVSPVVFYQQLGRGLRKKNDDDKVLILDFVANFERIQILNEFKDKIEEAKEGYEDEEGFKSDSGGDDSEEFERFSLIVDPPIFKERKLSVEELFKRVLVRIGSYSREEVIEGLKRLGKELGRVPIQEDVSKCDYLPCYPTIAGQFGSFNQALIEAGFEPNRRRWSKEETISSLRELGRELGRVPTWKDVEGRSCVPSFSTIAGQFGSFRQALIEAGFELNVNCWTKEEIIEGLKRLSEELGRVPTRKDVDDCSYLSHSDTVERFFGSFSQALIEAGFEPNLRFWTKEEIIEGLKRLSEELGRVPIMKDTDDCNYLPSSTVFKKQFGSFRQALIEAGFEPNARRWSKEEIIEGLKRFKKEFGRVPMGKDIGKCSYLPAFSTIGKQFGSFSQALIEAGFETSLHFWTKERIIDGLKRLGKELGRVPAKKDVGNYDYLPSNHTIRGVLGSFNQALIEAGFEPNVRFWTKEEIIEGLKRLGKELGRVPIQEDVKKCNYLPSLFAIARQFGSFSQALIEAGFEPNARFWTKEENIEGLKRLSEELGRVPMQKDVRNCDYLPTPDTIRKQFGSFNQALVEAGFEPKKKH